MQALTTEELKKLRTVYFADFVENAMFMDVNKYFKPYNEDSYLLLPENHVGHALWLQRFKITKFTGRNLHHNFFSQLFDTLLQDPSFEGFVVNYRDYLIYAENLQGKAWYEYLEHFEKNKMNQYIKSDFRFDIDVMIKNFWQCIIAENRLEELYPNDLNEQQLKVCKYFVHHYINRLPVSQLPHFSNTLSNFQKLKNWFKSL